MSLLRFSDENLITSITASSATSGFPSSNALDYYRGKYWMASASYTIDSTNKNIYINDGSDKTVTLTEDNYTSNGLAAHIASRLNASSSLWGCSFSTSTKKFTITRSSSGTIRKSVTTNASWNTIGFTSSSDDSGTSFTAEEARIHWGEALYVDFGAATEPDMFFIVVPKDQVGFSSSAGLRLQANTSNTWTSPALDIALEHDTFKSVHNLEVNATRNYRYWRVLLQDPTNTSMEYVRISYLFLGTYIELVNRNISSGYLKEIVDQSFSFESDFGNKSKTERPLKEKYSNMSIPFMTKTNREELMEYFNSKKTIIPFLTMFDPDLKVSNDYNDLSVWGNLVQMPSMQHVRSQYFTLNFSIEENL